MYYSRKFNNVKITKNTRVGRVCWVFTAWVLLSLDRACIWPATGSDTDSRLPERQTGVEMLLRYLAGTQCLL